MGKTYKRFAKILMLAALVAGFFGVACGFLPARLPRGCQIEGIDVSGMRREEAAACLREKLRAELEGRTFTIVVEARAYVFRPPELFYRTDLESVLAHAHRGVYWLEKQLCLAEEEAVLRGICDDFYVRSAPARRRFDPSSDPPFSFEAERVGMLLDGAALKAQVDEALACGAREVRAKPERHVPGFTLKQAKESAVLLSSFTTYYSEDNQNRAHNIQLAAQKLNGCTVGPGEGFSFNARVGARTRANGFLEAPVILEGEFVSGVGGGVCQVSTTVYNAALLAGLSVTEYHPHSLAVGYVEPSRDAMVNGAKCDLQWKNRLGGRVWMVCRADGGALNVRIYGARSGVTYAVESAVTGSIEPPAPELRVGTEEREIRAAKSGICSEAYLVRRNADGTQVRERLRRDRYAPVRAVRMVLPDPEPSASPAPALVFSAAYRAEKMRQSLAEIC